MAPPVTSCSPPGQPAAACLPSCPGRQPSPPAVTRAHQQRLPRSQCTSSQWHGSSASRWSPICCPGSTDQTGRRPKGRKWRRGQALLHRKCSQRRSRCSSSVVGDLPPLQGCRPGCHGPTLQRRVGRRSLSRKSRAQEAAAACQRSCCHG